AIQAIQPQMIVRFGATFPDIVEGKGKNKCVRKDYYRRQPQFDLNAVDSFNDGLVKGIDIYYPNLPEEQANNRYI
ncbi:type III restriction-modification system StyLTI enzyme res, partial [Salmonella enterica subsp. enterica serovar Enteritidis str. 13183-1]